MKGLSSEFVQTIVAILVLVLALLFVSALILPGQ